MSRDIEQQPDAAPDAAENKPARKPAKPRKLRIFQDLDGKPLYANAKGFASAKEYGLTKFDLDVLVHWHGEKRVELPGIKKTTEALLTQFNPDQPMPDHRLRPGAHSPICIHCGLCSQGSRNPFLPSSGTFKPLVTVIMDSVGIGEDERGEIATSGAAKRLKEVIEDNVDKTGVHPEEVRWLAMTRCANRGTKKLNVKSRGQWCRYHIIDDLARYRPQLIIPVGTSTLGLLSHKSNAQEWGGRLLTYRGWPDDFLTDPRYALPRPDPRDPSKQVVGHPVFGPIPDWRIPMVPIQHPKLVYMAQNAMLNKQYRNSIIRALVMARDGVEEPIYTRPWYRFTDDPAVVEAGLGEILQHPGLLVCYDTETTGLRPWETQWRRINVPDFALGIVPESRKMVLERGNARIVSMMFRWIDPATQEPRSLGFPWDSDRWPIQKHMDRLRPLIWKALTQSKLIGHNLTFDMLFSWSTLNHEYTYGEKSHYDNRKLNLERDRVMRALADACCYDTWHMAFAHKQERGSLGLEVLAYKEVPDLAGYEEDMTLLIDLHGEDMNPADGKGGHYLNCPKDKTETHLVPYIMGDVEVAYRAYERLKEKLEVSKRYEIPIADPEALGRFRYYQPQDRHWVYENIMSPAARVLMKMMARGLFIDQEALAEFSNILPKQIKKECDNLSEISEAIRTYCFDKRTDDPSWNLDLENKTQLKELLFDRLRLPVLRLTKMGRLHYAETFGTDNVDAIKQRMFNSHSLSAVAPGDRDYYINQALVPYAAVDKFTLNKLTVQFEHLRPLRNYRKFFKLYSTYIRPLQNIRTEVDKKARKADAHLCFDGCIHASFLMTGTRGGRLSCKDPNLQQLPRDGVVKALFTSRFGARGCIFNADLSQIELRLLAAISGDPTMVKAYHDGIDLHTLTASRIFDMQYDEFSKEHMKKLQDAGKDAVAKELDTKRNIAKTCNFLTGYGGGAFGLQNVLAMKDIDKPLVECEQIIELFFDSYPSVRRLLSNYKSFIEREALAVSMFGRVRLFDEIMGEDREARSKALRAGCNHLIQSTASDMMLAALFCIESLMRDAGLESLLVSTVHDSLLIDTVRTELPQVYQIVSDVLNNFPVVFQQLFGSEFDQSWMIVPFTGDSEIGIDYLKMKKVQGDNPDWDKLLSPAH